MQELKWKVVGLNLHSCNLFLLPNKHLYFRLEKPRLKIKNFNFDCIVPVLKPGLKGLRTGLKLISVLVHAAQLMN